MTSTFDIAILGAGSAGYACALRAAQLGLSVALVDDTPLGGTCLHRGCIPTKAWLQAAKVHRTVRKAPAFGIEATVDGVDAAKVRDYADATVVGLHQGLTGLISSRGITVIAERGSIVADDGRGPGIETGAAVHRARAVVVATGAAPVTLGLPVDGSRIVTSEEALRLDTLPSRAVVLGGGVIGVEFASLWADLGVEVTLVEAADRLLPAEEPGHARILEKELSQRGVTIRLGSTLSEAEAVEGGVRVSVGEDRIDADLLLVAVGRRPNTQGLELDRAGVRISGSGHVEVDANLQTSSKGIYAAGDLVAGPQLAHRGYAHGIFLAERIAKLQGRSAAAAPLPRDLDIARVTYSSPQVASVGLTADQAGPDATVADYQLTGNGRARILRGQTGRETGVVRLVRSPHGEIVGVHLIGEDISELIAEGALIVGWQASPDDLAPIVHPHPSLSEAIAEANWALAGRALHMHG